jgi:hypothetical protein
VSKKPKALIAVVPQKQPRIASDPTSYHERKPSWRVSRIDLVDPYGWHRLSATELHTIRDKLAHFESMTWADILIKAKKHNHSVPISDLCSQAQGRLKEIHCDDLDELLSLHLSGLERVWGILDRGVMTLLWWDPKHQVCPSLLKHT